MVVVMAAGHWVAIWARVRVGVGARTRVRVRVRFEVRLGFGSPDAVCFRTRRWLGLGSN